MISLIDFKKTSCAGCRHVEAKTIVPECRDCPIFLHDYLELKHISRRDRNGNLLMEGDIVAECQVGDVIWDGKAIVRRRPLGLIIIRHDYAASNYLPSQETDFYNVSQIREGQVELTSEADEWMIKGLSGNGKFASLHISRYDGRFYGWNNIERVGNIHSIFGD